MVEINFSGESRYDLGAEYTKYLLREISTTKSPDLVIIQVKNLAAIGTISESVARVLTNFLQHPQE